MALKPARSGRKTIRFDHQYYDEQQSEISIASTEDYDIPLRLRTYRGYFNDFTNSQFKATSLDTTVASIAAANQPWTTYDPATANTTQINVSNEAAGTAVIEIEARDKDRTDITDKVQITVTCT